MIKMGDNYSHYFISYNITNLSWVSYVTPAPFAEIRVTINFSTKFHHKNFIPRSDRDQDHSLLLISADDPIRSTVSVYSSTTVAETTDMEEMMIRKSIDQALQNVPLSAGARYCTRELLTEIVFALLEKKETILGVHLIELDMKVVFTHYFVIGGCDGPRQSSCCICLEDFIPPSSSSSSDQALEVLPCWHVFHYDCLRSWRRTHTRPHCPLCRKIRGRDFIISL